MMIFVRKMLLKLNILFYVLLISTERMVSINYMAPKKLIMFFNIYLMVQVRLENDVLYVTWYPLEFKEPTVCVAGKAEPHILLWKYVLYFNIDESKLKQYGKSVLSRIKNIKRMVIITKLISSNFIFLPNNHSKSFFLT